MPIHAHSRAHSHFTPSHFIYSTSRLFARTNACAFTLPRTLVHTHTSPLVSFIHTQPHTCALKLIPLHTHTRSPAHSLTLQLPRHTLSHPHPQGSGAAPPSTGRDRAGPGGMEAGWDAGERAGRPVSDSRVPALGARRPHAPHPGRESWVPGTEGRGVSRGSRGTRAGRGRPGGVPVPPVPAGPRAPPRLPCSAGPPSWRRTVLLRRCRDSRAAAPRPRPRSRHLGGGAGPRGPRRPRPARRRRAGATGELPARCRWPAAGGGVGVSVRARSRAPARGAAWGRTSAFSGSLLSPERGKVAPLLDGIRNRKSGSGQATLA